MKHSKESCEGCLHWYGAYEANRCCNYIFDMGHRRPWPTAGPGEACAGKTPVRKRADLKMRKAKEFL